MGKIVLEYISREKLESLGEGKVDYIARGVAEGKVMLLEEMLTPEERLKLVQKCMGFVQEGKITGVEFVYKSKDELKKMRGLFSFLSRKSLKRKMMLVGPSELIKEVKDREDVIEMIIER